MECIVLAGGLGTRLRSITKDLLPKCMASVNGNPFLYYLFRYLTQHKAERVILSLGHRSESILEWIRTQHFDFEIDYVIEQEPMGTGGGMRLALTKSKKDHVAVLNGDTLFLADLHELFQFHLEKNATTTLALKEMREYERYGSVVLDGTGCIKQFEEKQYKSIGYINAGIYLVNKPAFLNKTFPEKFSFEKDYLERYVTERAFFGKSFDNYFIDIGIPEDFEKAQEDFVTLFV